VNTGPLQNPVQNPVQNQVAPVQKPAAPVQTQVAPIPKTPAPAPLQNMRTWFNGWNDRRKNQARVIYQSPPVAAPEQKSSIEKMRDKVAEFDEDYRNVGERLLGFFMQLVGYFGPFALVIWIGSDLGKYYTPVMDKIPAYGMSFTMECIIAACTVALGRAWGEIASGKANWGRMCAIMLIWLTLNASSAFGLYLVMTKGGKVGGLTEFVMIARVVAIALCDLGCAAILMFKGMSLQKHIEAIRKKATAIGELSDAQRQIEEADKNAQLRDQMMKSTLKIQEDLSQKIGDAVSMVMSSIMTKMEKALNEDDTRQERGFGKR